MRIGGVFIDGANMSRTLSLRLKTNNPRIDYGRLIQKLDSALDAKFAFRTYYTTHQNGEAMKRRESFYEHLRSNKWTVFDLPAKLIVNSDHPDGVWMDKGVDLAIGLDAYRLALLGHAAVLAIATHDTDFVQLFKRLPTSVEGVVIGWKEWLSPELTAVARPVYMNDLGVIRR